MIDGTTRDNVVVRRNVDSQAGRHDLASVGAQVRRLRIAAGLTQHELASRAGSSQPALAHIEAGRRTPTLTTLEKLARALGHDLVVVLPCNQEEASA